MFFQDFKFEKFQKSKERNKGPLVSMDRPTPGWSLYPPNLFGGKLGILTYDMIWQIKNLIGANLFLNKIYFVITARTSYLYIRKMEWLVSFCFQENYSWCHYPFFSRSEWGN